jgi:hypothetical protein
MFVTDTPLVSPLEGGHNSSKIPYPDTDHVELYSELKSKRNLPKAGSIGVNESVRAEEEEMAHRQFLLTAVGCS